MWTTPIVYGCDDPSLLIHHNLQQTMDPEKLLLLNVVSTL